jgi:hypothetical protein
VAAAQPEAVTVGARRQHARPTVGLSENRQTARGASHGASVRQAAVAAAAARAVNRDRALSDNVPVTQA